MIYTAIGLTAVLGVLPMAGSAAADSSDCTHNWDGPQICIKLEGNNGWNSVTGRWTNPPSDVKSRPMTMWLNGKKDDTQTAKRHGDEISYHWTGFQQGTGVEVCVTIKGSERKACQTTEYNG